MNGTIISPSVFYWMSVVDSIVSISIVASIFLVIAFIVLAVLRIVTHIELDDANTERTLKKAFTLVSICLAVSISIVVFCPSKDTMVEMLVAKTVTYENAQWTVDTVKEAVDYIVQAIATLK